MSSPQNGEDYISQRISEIHRQYDQFGISGLAQAYEDFKKEVLNGEAAAFKGEAGSLVLQRIKDLENLFSTVTGNEVKELSMFMKDSEALRRTAEFASINAEHIRFGNLGSSLTVDEFVKAVKKYMNPDFDFEGAESSAAGSSSNPLETFSSLDWRKLGIWFYSYSKAAVPSHFLYGPLATKRRRVGPRARTVDDTVSNTNKTTAQDVAAAELQDDPEQSTSHMVRIVYGVLIAKGGDGKVNLFRFFINPHSFAQSVENLFYTSFLVRDGKLKVEQGSDEVPYIFVPEEELDDALDESNSSFSHHVATFNHAAWRSLIEKFQITESYIPHRAMEEDHFSDSQDVSDSSSVTEDSFE